MSETKHTPGPWEVEDNDGYGGTFIYATGVTTAEVVGDSAEAIANALLIAAAPELLEALKALADDHEFGATGAVRQDHLKAARTAIAKAEGR